MKIEKQIKDLIINNKIRTQTELSEKLKAEYNLNITQSNLSNLLKKMNVIKSIENNDSFYAIQNMPLKIDEWIKNLVISINSNESIILIKTYSGAGNIIGQIIDEQKLKTIMGTVSGDNTVLIIPNSIKKIKEIAKTINSIFDL
ncbi:MAG: hypothetical protein PHY80_01530 [Rickettsiales bacterium]|nr:hypothetical protein [Rickettsiales bacterium]